jgi:hypothetical protein
MFKQFVQTVLGALCVIGLFYACLAGGLIFGPAGIIIIILGAVFIWDLLTR